MILQRAFVLGLSLFVVAIAHAEDEELAPTPTPTPIEMPTPAPKYSGFSVGLESGFFDYEEPGLMRDSGLLTGLAGRYETSEPIVWRYRLRVEASALYGSIAYSGATWTGTPVTDTSHDLMLNTRVLFVRDFKWTHLTISPYPGVGLRYLNDRGTGAGSYEREIFYLYIPVGAEFDWRLSDRFHIGFTPELDDFVLGRVKTHLSDVDSSLPDITSNQDSGLGARFSLHFGWNFETYALRLEPYIQYWSILPSDSTYINSSMGYGAEPQNNSTQYGLTVLIRL